jgi:hypothetical protein
MTMKRIRFLFGCLAVLFGFMATDARAQSSRQIMTFSVLTDYQDETNDAPADPGLTNVFIQPLLITSGNIVKAILLDVKGRKWTNWTGATLQRQINLITGEEGVYITLGGTNELNVSSFFSDTYVSNFTEGVLDAFPFATNNFTYSYTNDIVNAYTNITDGSTNVTLITNTVVTTNDLQSPYPPLFNGQTSSTFVHHRSSAGLHFISVNTRNLKLNLLGASLQAPGDGAITTFTGRYKGTNYSMGVQKESIYIVGTFSWNKSTNFFSAVTNVTNVFFSGPARGSVIIGVPTYSAITPAPE